MVVSTTSKLKAKPPEEVTPGHIKGLLFSESGAGKTWFTLQFPNPYYIDTEGGADLKHYMARLKASGGGYMGPEEGACDFDTVADQIKALTSEKHGYRTLVIDSITKLYQTRIANEADRLGDKDAFGASKKPAIKQMRRLVSLVDRLDMNVWFIAHEVAQWGGEGGERKEIGRMPDVWDKLIYELDLTLQIKKHNKGFRTATVYKSRLEGFPDGDRFDLQKDGKDVGYAEFTARYGKDFIEAAPKTVALATPEQVAEIVRLLEVVRVPPEDMEKVLAKAGAETFSDLTEEQAGKTVTWLNSKVSGKNGG